jgi:hypothetical protein
MRYCITLRSRPDGPDYGAGMTAASSVGQPTAGGKLFDKKRDAKPTAESCAVAGTVTRQS